MQSHFKTEILLQATPAQVWDALINPDKIARYLFGAQVQTSWEEGSSIDFLMHQDGVAIRIVHGTIIKVVEQQVLEHTLFPSTWEGMEDILSNHLHIRYELKATDEGTHLSISQFDFTQVAEGSKRYEDTVSGWKAMLPLLQEVAEG